MSNLDECFHCARNVNLHLKDKLVLFIFNIISYSEMRFRLSESERSDVSTFITLECSVCNLVETTDICRFTFQVKARV